MRIPLPMPGAAELARRCSHAAAHRRGRAGELAGAETGDTIIEVLVSALLIGFIVIATFTGFDSNNHATALTRERSQADALAQQDEEQLRSEPVTKLQELNRTYSVTENGTKYTIETTGKYYSDASGTVSCTSATPQANYIKTTSTVSWPALGAGKKVAETSIISPPAGTALIVQVTSPVEPVPGATVSLTGASTASAETSSDGCAVLDVPPGEYTIDVSKLGYVDPNGYEHTEKDPAVTHSAYLVAETTTKESYFLAPAGKLEVSFTGAAPAEGDSFVEFNSSQTGGPKSFGTLESYKPVIESEAVFPFTSADTVYSGTCEADLPTKNGLSENPEAFVLAGKSTKVSVPLGPVKIDVMSGTRASSPGLPVAGAVGYTEDIGCKEAKRSFVTKAGLVAHPGLPFGTFKLCVGTGGALGRRFEAAEVKNNSTSGPTGAWSNGGTSGGIATIYLGTSPSGAPAGTVPGGSCP